MTRLYHFPFTDNKGGGDKSSSSKYKNEKIMYQGEEFDSKKEFEYYLILKDREKRKEITQLSRQVPFEIQPDFVTPEGKKIRAILYYADFVYYENGIMHIIDVKGFRTEVYKLKKKLLAYQGYYIEEV